MYKLYITLKNFCQVYVRINCRKVSRGQARHSSEILQYRCIQGVASGGERGASFPPKNILEQKFLFLKYQAENLKLAEITLLYLLV